MANCILDTIGKEELYYEFGVKHGDEFSDSNDIKKYVIISEDDKSIMYKMKLENKDNKTVKEISFEYSKMLSNDELLKFIDYLQEEILN